MTPPKGIVPQPCKPSPDDLRRPAPALARPPVPVALVITDLDVGGAERALVALATGLDRRRWSPSVVGLGGEGALAGPLRAAGIPVDCLDVIRASPTGRSLELAGASGGARPRLVQSFLFHANVASQLAGAAGGASLGGRRAPRGRARKGWHLRLDRLTSRLSCGSVCVSEGVRAVQLRGRRGSTPTA